MNSHELALNLPMDTKLRIPQNKLEAICARYAVHELAIFGSAIAAECDGKGCNHGRRRFPH